MQHEIRIITGKRLIIDISDTDTGLDVKLKIYEKEGIHPAQMRLVLAGKQVENNVNYNQHWRDNGKVAHGHLVLRLKPINTNTRAITLAAFVLAQSNRDQSKQNKLGMLPHDILVLILSFIQSEGLTEKDNVQRARNAFNNQQTLFAKVKKVRPIMLELFNNLEKIVKANASVFDANAQFSYLHTVLRAIRKNMYSALAKDPENNGIPLDVFNTAIMPVMKSNPNFLKLDAVSTKVFETVEKDLLNNSPNFLLLKHELPENLGIHRFTGLKLIEKAINNLITYHRKSPKTDEISQAKSRFLDLLKKEIESYIVAEETSGNTKTTKAMIEKVREIMGKVQYEKAMSGSISHKTRDMAEILLLNNIPQCNPETGKVTVARQFMIASDEISKDAISSVTSPNTKR